MAMQSCGKPELQRSVWRLRRPLAGRAKQSTEEQLRSPDFVQRQLCRYSAAHLDSCACILLQPLRTACRPQASVAHHAAFS